MTLEKYLWNRLASAPKMAAMVSFTYMKFGPLSPCLVLFNCFMV